MFAVWTTFGGPPSLIVLLLLTSMQCTTLQPKNGEVSDGERYIQGIGKDVTPIPTYPVMGNPYVSPIWWVFMGYNPQESLENIINTMGTPLGVHPIVP